MGAGDIETPDEYFWSVFQIMNEDGTAVSEVDFARRGKSVASEQDDHMRECSSGGQNRLRRNTNFSRWFKVIGQFKPGRENISLFPKIKSDVWSSYPAVEKEQLCSD